MPPKPELISTGLTLPSKTRMSEISVESSGAEFWPAPIVVSPLRRSRIGAPPKAPARASGVAFVMLGSMLAKS